MLQFRKTFQRINMYLGSSSKKWRDLSYWGRVDGVYQKMMEANHKKFSEAEGFARGGHIFRPRGIVGSDSTTSASCGGSIRKSIKSSSSIFLSLLWKAKDLKRNHR